MIIPTSPIPATERDDHAPGKDRRRQQPNRQDHAYAFHEIPPLFQLFQSARISQADARHGARMEEQSDPSGLDVTGAAPDYHRLLSASTRALFRIEALTLGEPALLIWASRFAITNG